MRLFYRAIMGELVVASGDAWAAPKAVVFFAPDSEADDALAETLLSTVLLTWACIVLLPVHSHFTTHCRIAAPHTPFDVFLLMFVLVSSWSPYADVRVQSNVVPDSRLQGMLLGVVPAGVVNGFVAAECQIATLTPELARYHLRRGGAAAVLGGPDDALRILRYATSDGCAGTALHGLAIVPTATGEVVRVLPAATPGPELLYLCKTDRVFTLLQAAGGRLVHPSVTANVTLCAALSAEAMTATTNVRVVDASHLRGLLETILPSAWFADQAVPGWEAMGRVGDAEPAAWLALLWAHLALPEDLGPAASKAAVDSAIASICGMACVPVKGGVLLPLGDPRYAVVDVSRFPEELRPVIRSLGVMELDDRFELDPRIVAGMMCPPTMGGLLQALERGCRLQGVDATAVCAPLDPAARRLLFGRCAVEVSSIAKPQLDFLRSVPWLETHAAAGAADRFVAPRGKVLWIAPMSAAAGLLGPTFVKYGRSADATALLNRLGLSVMAKAQFLSEHLLSKLIDIEVELRDQALVAMLEDLPALCKESPGFGEQLKGLRCIPTVSGELQAASALFDPEVIDVEGLMDHRRCYPAGRFAEGEVLHALRNLGLRTALDCEALLEIAHQISIETDPAVSRTRGCALLRYLDTNFEHLFGGKRGGSILQSLYRTLKKTAGGMDPDVFFGMLAKIAWVPVLTQPPVPGMPWDPAFAEAPMALAAAVRPPGEAWLVSGGCRLLDAHGATNEELQRYLFPWDRPLDPMVLVRQLVALGGSEFDPQARDPFSIHLARNMPALHEQLDRAVRGPALTGDPGRREKLRAAVEGQPWVWTGGGFQTADRVALNCFVDCRPWLHQVPADFVQQFAAVYRLLGVPDEFNQHAYEAVLAELKTEFGADPLPDAHLRLVVALVGKIGDMGMPKDDLLIPNDRGVLCAASSLVYNDSAWAPPAQHQLVHGKISNLSARQVGVRSLVQAVVDPTNSAKGGWEAYGQTESLTDRLRGLLDVYPDGPSIFKELIQNADDAGATTMRIMYSTVEYGQTSLLGEDMEIWQGPALYVFNDAQFASSDFDNLAKLARSDKGESAAVTGRFGVGFNSVYHFTDLPCILSGDHLVLLDPHKAYLPGAATYARPGLKLKYTGSTLAQQFPDQFAPFTGVFGADMKTPFKGTLFRFPLRGPAAAKQSELKNQTYGAAQIADLFTSFKAHVEEMLLFMNNVKSLTIEVAHDHGAPQTLYSVDVETTRANPDVWSQLNTSPKALTHVEMVEALKRSEGATRQDPRCRKSSAVRLKSVPDPESITAAVCAPAAAGSAAIVLEESVATWVVFDQLGGARLNHLATHPDYLHLKLVPRLGIAARVPADPVTGRAYVVLPLPVNTGLPVHANAHFEISNNRRDLWSGGDMTGDGQRRTEWNQAVLDELGSLYAHAMQHLVQNTSDAERYRLFPLSHVGAPWDTTVRNFYRQVVATPAIRLHGGEPAAPEHAVFLPEDLVALGVDRGAFTASLAKLGLPVVEVHLPDTVSAAFRKYAADRIKAASPEFLRAAARAPAGTGPRLRFEELPFAEAQAVIGFMLSDTPSLVDILDVRMLPLTGGGFGSIRKSSTEEPVYIGSGEPGQNVLRHLGVGLLDPRCQGGKLHSAIMRAVGDGSKLNICCPSVQQVGQLVAAKFSVAAKGACATTVPAQMVPAVLHDVWQYIGSVVEEFGAPAVVEAFGTVPLLPTTDGARCLADAAQMSSILPLDTYEPNVASALKKLRCSAVDYSAASLDRRVLVAAGVATENNAVAVFGAFAALRSSGAWDDEFSVFKQLVDVEIRALFMFLEGATAKMTDDHCSLLARLPVMEVVSAGAAMFVAASDWPDRLWLPPPKSQVQTELLVAASRARFVVPGLEDSALVRAMGVRPMQRAVLFSDHILPAHRELSIDLQQSITRDLLRNITDFSRESVGWLDVLRDAPFVPNRAGKLCRVAELFDPAVVRAAEIMTADDCYPAEEHCQPEDLEPLKQLGLLTAINPPFVLRAATTLSMAASDGSDDNGNGTPVAAIVERARSLMRFLNEPESGAFWAALLQDAPAYDAFKAVLTTARFVPVQGDPVHSVLKYKWKGRAGTLAAPCNVRPPAEAWLVGTDLLVAEVEPSPNLAAAFGWDAAPPWSSVARGLLELQTMWSKGVIGDEALSTTIDAQYSSAMSILGAALAADAAADAAAEATGPPVDLSMLKGKPCIWVSGTFIPAAQFAINPSDEVGVSAKPYLYSMQDQPAGGEDAVRVYQAIGVQEQFLTSHYKIVLEKLAALDRSRGGEALEPDHVTLACAIVNLIGADLDAGSAIFMPSSDGHILPVGQVTYNDAEWLENSDSVGGFKFVHVDISHETAAKLGVRSLKSLLNANSEYSGSVDCPSVRELYGTLRMCEDGRRASFLLRPFMELADFCQVEQVSFFLDEREHSALSILQPRLRAVQGPSLVVVIPNTCFSPKRIARFMVPSLTPQLTEPPSLAACFACCDVVSVLSGNNVSFFDPSGLVLSDDPYAKTDSDSAYPATAAGGAPLGGGCGKSFNIVESHLLAQFPNQFEPFVELGVGFNGQRRSMFEGTIFRLPLRTESQKATSSILNAHQALGSFGKEAILDEFEISRQRGGTLIAFSMHLSGLSFNRFKAPAATAAAATPAASVAPSPSPDAPEVDAAATDDPAPPSPPVAVAENPLLFKIMLRNGGDEVNRKRRMMAAISSWKPAVSFTGRRYPKASSSYRLLVDVVDEVDQLAYVDELLVVQSLAGPQSMEMSLRKELKHLGLRPFIGVSARMSSRPDGGDEDADPADAADSENIGFAFNPFPRGKTGLPVDVFGTFLPYGHQMSHQDVTRSQWNAALAEDLYKPWAVLIELLIAEPSMRANPFRVYSYWPELAKCDPFYSNLVKRFYKKIATKPVFCLGSKGKYGLPKEGYFLTSSVGAALRSYIGVKIDNCIEIKGSCMKELIELDENRGMFQRKLTAELTPAVLRNHVQDNIKSERDIELPPAAEDDTPVQPMEIASQMFEFLAKDLKSPREHQRLVGLYALPLSTGHLVTCGTAAVLATPEEHLLLNEAEVRIVHPVLCAAVAKSQSLRSLATSLNLRTFDANFLKGRMDRLVPVGWKGRKTVVWDRGDCSNAQLNNIWAYLCPVTPLDSKPEPPSHVSECQKRCSVLRDWPLLPLRNQNLLTLSARTAVLSPEELGPAVPQDVVDAAEHYGIPVLHPDFSRLVEATTTTPKPAATDVAAATTPDGVAAAKLFGQKVEVAHRSGLLQTQLEDAGHATNLFGYLMQECAGFEDRPDTKEALRCLPVYPAFGCERWASCHRATYTFDPADFPAEYTPQNLSDCLASPAGAEPLWTYLGVSVLSTAAMLSEQVLPHWEMHEPEMQAQLMQLLKSKWQELKVDEPRLVTVLNSTPCLTNAEGQAVTPATLIDTSTNAVLALVFRDTPSRLPDPELYDPSWSEFLRDIGVRSTLDEPLFRECCMIIQRSPAAATATALLKHFNANASTLGADNRDFYSWFAGVPIVPTARPGKAAAGDGEACVLTPLRACSVERDRALVFQIRPIVPKELEPSQVFWAKVGLQSPPPPDVVIDNLAAITTETLETWDQPMGLEDAFNAIYTYLGDRLDRLASPDAARLLSIPVVPVVHRMVPASHIFFSCRDNLAPFLFELPRCYSQHDELFRSLKVAEQPSQPVLVDIVADLHASLAGASLNPSEVCACMRLLEVIMANSGKRLPSRTQLFVPDIIGCLVPTNRCVLNDAPHLLIRIAPELADFRFVSHRVPEAMCGCFGVKKLSEIVLERFVQPETGVEAGKPLSAGFVAAVLSLLRMYSRHIEPHSFGEMERRARELAAYSVMVAPLLTVALHDVRSKRNVTQADALALSYVDHRTRTIWVAADLPGSVAFEDALGTAVNRIVAPDLPLPLAALLRADRASHSADGGGGDAAGTVASVLGLTSTEQDDLRRGACGEKVLERDSPLLQLKALRPFHEKEICAVQGADGDLVYAEVVEQVEAGTDPSKPAAFSMAHYKVRVGLTEACVLVPSQMFSFRHAHGAPAPGHRLPAAAAASSDNGGLATGVDPTALQEMGEQGGAHGIPSVDYLGAVETLLSRANLSLSADRQQLMTRVIGLESENATLSAEVQSSQKELADAKRALEDVDQDGTCNICFQSSEDGVAVDTALIPCGHIYCGECAARLAGSRCATCKQPARGTLRVFR